MRTFVHSISLGIIRHIKTSARGLLCDNFAVGKEIPFVGIISLIVFVIVSPEISHRMMKQAPEYIAIRKTRGEQGKFNFQHNLYFTSDECFTCIYQKKIVGTLIIISIMDKTLSFVWYMILFKNVVTDTL